MIAAAGMTLLVPRGAEAAAVRRAHTGLAVVELHAGSAAAASLPEALETPVVVLGLCGALREAAAGDVVVYRRIGGTHDGVAADPEMVHRLLAALASARAVDACSTTHVVTTVRERRELAARYAADVVDMEAAPLAAALAARGVRFAMVRVVSDDASRDLPALERAIGADGRLDLTRIALAFAARPRAAFAFVRDVRRALSTLTSTAASLADVRP